jgi:hypothetical protein
LCRGFESLLRYHPSPHQFGLLADKGGEMADDLGLDPSVGAIMNDHAIDQRAESGDRFRVFAVVEGL